MFSGSRYFLMAVLMGLAACSGIPLRSVPHLLNLQSTLMDSDLADLTLAIQLDERIAPPPGAVPQLILKITPSDPEAFAPVDRQFPLVALTAWGGMVGLPALDRGRRWLIYRLSPDARRDLGELRDRFKALRDQKGSGKGGALSIGIAQEGMAVKDPVFASSRWESWLQVSRTQGFFQLWSGTTAELLRQSQR